MIIKAPEFFDLENIFQIFLECKEAMRKQRIFQWTDNYPTVDIIANDINNRHLYGLSKNDKWLGVIVLNTTQSAEYNNVNWEDSNGRALIVHRLAIKPEFQNRGYSKKLMDFAESFAAKNHFTSIRLDTYSANNISLQLYQQRGYVKRGEVKFPERDLPFICFEKIFN